jgi:flagellar biosynthesis chaperone FliJ
MAEQKVEKSKSMTKWIAIGVIAVLVIAIVVTTVLLSQKIGSLNRDLDDARAQVATLQGQVSNLQTNVSTLQGQLNQEKATTATLNTELSGAKSQISTLDKTVASQQTTISDQAATIKTMRYPKNFATSEELANWLQKDNTNTLYSNPTTAQKTQLAFILQIHAARDGYIVTTNLPIGGSLDSVTNRAIVGDYVYEITPWNDIAQRWFGVPAMPSYPITPESGQ